MRPFVGLARLLAATILVAAGVAAATTYVEMTLDEMIGAADVAILAEVRDVQPFERDGRPWTRVTLAVELDLIDAAATGETPAEPPAGEPDEGEPTEVQLEFLGGALPGGPSLAVAGMPTFQPGERVLALAYERDDALASPIVGFRQGLWRVSADALVSEAGIVLGLEDGAIVPGGSPSPVAAVLDVLVERFGDLP
jgi:hypothetical protein